MAIYQFKRYAVGCYDVTLLLGLDERIGSVKRMDAKWWALTPAGESSGPHSKREDAAAALLAAYHSRT